MKLTVQTLLVAASLIVTTVGSALADTPGLDAPTVVPEPGTLALFGVGAAGFLLYKKIKK